MFDTRILANFWAPYESAPVWPAVNADVDLVSLRVAHLLGGSSRQTSDSQLAPLIGSRCGVLVVKARKDEVRFRRRWGVHVRFKARAAWRRGRPVALLLCLRVHRCRQAAWPA